MPRRRNRRSKRRPRQGGLVRGMGRMGSSIQGNGPSADMITRCRANGYFTVNMGSANPTFFTLNTLFASGLSTRLVTLGDVFCLCRAVNLDVTFVGSVGDAFVSYQSFESAVPVTSAADVSELPNVSVYYNGQTVPCRLTVNRRELLSYNPLAWFPTKQSANDVSFDQGQLVFASTSSSAVIRVEFRVEFEFCVPVPTGNERKIVLPLGIGSLRADTDEEWIPQVEVKDVESVVETKIVNNSVSSSPMFVPRVPHPQQLRTQSMLARLNSSKPP